MATAATQVADGGSAVDLPLSTLTSSTSSSLALDWQPGFRFSPTDEELVVFYLRRKVSRRRFLVDAIADVDVYKCEPWELPEKSRLKTGDKQWFFFCARDRKYRNGSRSNRATAQGFWKSTGKDRTIFHNSSSAGNKKTLVFYRGRPPKGERTDWVMYEYTLHEHLLPGSDGAPDCFAVYKLFMKSGLGPKTGEQYGAPFVENNWKDKSVDAGSFAQQETVEHSGKSQDLPLHDLEELLLQISEQQDLAVEALDCSVLVLERDSILADDLSTTSLNLPSFEKANQCFEQRIEENCLQSDISCWDVTNSAAASGNLEMACCAGEADNEYVEINDFFDADCFLPSMNAIGNDNSQIPTGDILFDTFEQFDDSAVFSETFDEDNNSFYHATDLWTQDPAFDVPTTSNATPCMVEPSSASGTENGVSGEPQAWLSSALHSLLDSIPTNPAMAAEESFHWRKYLQMSSFKMHVIRNQNSCPEMKGEAAPSSGGTSITSKRVLLFLTSLLVALCAILFTLYW